MSFGFQESGVSVRITRLLMAALWAEWRARKWGTGFRPIPFDGPAFVAAIRQFPAGHEMYSVFQVFPSSFGPRCIAFEDALRSAVAFGVVGWVAPEHRAFVIEYSERRLAECADDAFFVEMRELARRYFNAIGRDHKEMRHEEEQARIKEQEA